MIRSQLTQFSRLASRTVLVSASVLLLTALVISGSGLAAAPSTNDTGSGDPSSAQRSSAAGGNHSTAATQTLRIRANGTGKYIVTATGTVTVSKAESSEIVQPPVIQGTVGENSDRVDVIRFTGHITSFKHRGELRVTLDGRHAPPRVLDANYLEFSALRNNSTRYRFTGADTIIPAGDAERGDFSTTNRSRIDGHISSTDPTDSFYYTGRFDTSRASANLTVHINGHQKPVYKAGSRSTTPASSATSTSVSSATPLPTTATDVSEHSPASGRQRPPSTPASPSEPRHGGGGLSVLALVGGIGLMLLVAVGGIVLLSR
jgi:hypothetical protein